MTVLKCFKHFRMILFYCGEPNLDRRFTSSEVVTLTGMTPRQLQWWDERGIVVPLRAGRRRLYSFEDLAEVAVIGQLRSRGFSLQRVRKVMRFLQREFGQRLAETVTAGSDYHLLTEGSKIYVETSAQQVIEILKNSRQPIFAVCLSDAVRQISAELDAGAKLSRGLTISGKARGRSQAAEVSASRLERRRAS
jgi:DNA-binding transcriptional MerR regulator